MDNISRKTKGITLVVAIMVIALTVMTSDQRYVASPAFASILLVMWLWMKLWEQDKEIPFLDVGFICSLATLIYTVYPLFNYWVDSLNFGILSDYRLQQYHITPAELGTFHLRHVLYIFSFVIFYLYFRKRSDIQLANIQVPNKTTQFTILILFLLLASYFFLLRVTMGLDYNNSYESEEFSRNLSAFSSAPLLLVQISGKLYGIFFLFKLALLYIIISKCRQRMWLVVLMIWIALEIINTIIIGGARTGMMLFMLAAVLMYHRMVKRLSLRFLAMSGLILFLFFIFFGLYRMYNSYNYFKLDISQANAGIFSGNNEFQALLGTSYDVFQLKKNGIHLPWYLYINDFISILPPRQLIPFEKISAGDWYLEQIGLYGTGVGYMWGVISQSVIGLDWFELFLRGAILGYLLAKFHNWFNGNQSGFLENLFYIFICVKIYYTYRETTFSILTNVVWEIMPFYIILRLAAGRYFFQTTPVTESTIPAYSSK